VPKIDDIVDRYGSQRNLAISLFFYLFADAVLGDNKLLTYSILALMIITGPLATSKKRHHMLINIALAVLMVVLGYASQYIDTQFWHMAASLTASAFFFSLIYLISYALLFEQTRVTGETLWAAINVYVLIGMLFAFLYAFLTILEPGAFSGSLVEDGTKDITQTFLYYSFVTMTTLGYGDISPKIQVAMTLAYLQALIGQLYVAILIARLVSLYSRQPEE